MLHHPRAMMMGLLKCNPAFSAWLYRLFRTSGYRRHSIQYLDDRKEWGTPDVCSEVIATLRLYGDCTPVPDPSAMWIYPCTYEGAFLVPLKQNPLYVDSYGTIHLSKFGQGARLTDPLLGEGLDRITRQRLGVHCTRTMTLPGHSIQYEARIWLRVSELHGLL